MMPYQPDLFDDPPKHNETGSMDQVVEAILIQKDTSNATLSELVPDTAILALTRQYGVQAIHISKILSYSQKKSLNGQEIIRDEISDELTLTWARTQGTLNVIRRMCLITSHNKLTPFGKLVFSVCPYVDNAGLLWLFHYLLGSNANLVIWSHLFNGAFYKQEELSLQDIAQDLTVLSGRWSESSLKDKVPGETGGIMKAYTEGFLRPLSLITKLDLGKYACASNTHTIPSLVWLSTILVYRDQYYPGAPSLEIPLIIDSHFSPGRILRQDQASVRRALDDLHNAGLLTVETRSGLDQVRFKRDTTWLLAIAQHLGEANRD